MTVNRPDQSRIVTEPDQPVRRVDRVDREVVYEETRDTDYVAVDHLRRVDAYRRIATIVWTITGFIEIIVGLRVLFKFLGANAANGFVNFVYNLSGVFANPFQGIVTDVTSGSSVLEVNSLIAMLILALAAWGVMKLVWLLLTVSEPSRA